MLESYPYLKYPCLLIWRVVGLGLLMSTAGMAWGRDFSTQPPVAPLLPSGEFELGEGALNSLLSDALKEPFYMGTQPNLVRIAVRHVSFDFEEGSCTVSLRALVTYNFLHPQPVSVVFKYQKAISISAFSYSVTDGSVKASLPQLLAGYEGLPAYVKAHLTTKFGNMAVYTRNLLSNVGGSATVPASGAQISPYLPIFYMGAIQIAPVFLDDAVRLKVTPLLEQEDVKIGFYHENNEEDDRIPQYRVTIISNISGKVKWIRIWSRENPAFNAPPLFEGHGYALQLDGNPNPRRRRYNAVIPTTVTRCSNFDGNTSHFGSHGAKVELEMETGTRTYLASTNVFFPNPSRIGGDGCP